VARNRTKILAVASGGGHWIELLRILPAFEGAEVSFVTVNAEYRKDVGERRFHTVPDATRWNPLAMVLLLLRLLFILVRERPDFVVTTGAAPGFLALRLGRLLRAKTIWLDSLANVECLSMAGSLAGKHADLWLTQWPHLARQDGPKYAGSVL
jgi:UDP-N-acetylglucosamine:LPS N-acetylglucosamine transferase